MSEEEEEEVMMTREHGVRLSPKESEIASHAHSARAMYTYAHALPNQRVSSKILRHRRLTHENRDSLCLSLQPSLIHHNTCTCHVANELYVHGAESQSDLVYMHTPLLHHYNPNLKPKRRQHSHGCHAHYRFSMHAAWMGCASKPTCSNGSFAFTWRLP